MSAAQTPSGGATTPPPPAGDDHPPASAEKKSSTPPRRAAIYVRVSTSKQNTENQEHLLRQVATARGWHVEAVYDDTGVSGSKSSRPALDTMLKDATRGRFDVLMIYKLDRLGRSVIDLHRKGEHLQACGVDLYCHTQAIDTSTPTGRLMFTMLGAIAEFELDLMRDRIGEGIATARRKGVKLGRPKVESKVEDDIRRHLRAGVGMNKIAAQLGVGKLTVQRVKKEMA
jgi:DNA invertase Pin-like site-specific DNA recombinase